MKKGKRRKKEERTMSIVYTLLKIPKWTRSYLCVIRKLFQKRIKSQGQSVKTDRLHEPVGLKQLYI